ncbi:MAG: AbrB/MazE/SpoVT family DNA-binding domain-containing protein [Nitrospiraceae bacterium]
MDIAYVSTKGQLVIPARLRRKLGIKPGTKVCFIDRGNSVLFRPITKKYIRSLAGMLKSAISVTEDLLEEWKKDRKREKGKLIKRIF